MTEVLTKIVVDCATGEQTVVPLTAEELAQRELDAAAAAEAQAEREAAEAKLAADKAAAVAALKALGLTEDQINALKA